jgi:hypothetical protein
MLRIARIGTVERLRRHVREQRHHRVFDQRFANRIAVLRSDGRGVSFKSAQLQVDEKA